MLFRFGEFELDTALRELRSSGKRIDLQPKVFDLLLHLVEHHDRAIGKDELQDEVWPGMVVTETALTRAVMKARKAIGDDASQQSMIRTVHGHGYRFVTAVETLEPSSGPSPVQSPPGNPQRKRWPIALLATLAIILAVYGYWQAMKPPPAPPDLRIAVLPLVDNSGDPDLSWSRLGLMSLATRALVEEGDIPVVEDGNVAGLSSNLEWTGPIESVADSTLLDRLQRVYGATHALGMELNSEGSMLRMNYVLVDSQGKSRRGTMVGKDSVQLTFGVVQAVYGLLLGRSRLGGQEIQVSQDPFNNEAFARGMDLVLEGRCAEAVQFFRIIVEQEPELFSPRLELASCLRILGEPEEAEVLLLALIEEQAELQNTAPLGSALLVLGILQNRTGRLDEAESSYQAALDSANSANDADLVARANQNLAILAKNRGNWTTSAEYLDRAAAAYRKAGREIMPGQLWSGYANLKMEQGKLVEASEYLDKALEAFRSTGDRRNEAMMLNNYGYLRRMQGRLDEAENYHLRSLAIRQEIRDRVGVGRNYSMLSGLYTARGQYEDARDAAEQALAAARETSDRLYEGTSLAQLANAERRLGLADQARGHYRDSQDVFLSLQDTMRALQVELKLAGMELKQGLPDAAESIALDVLEQAREHDFVQPEIESMVLLADASLARRQDDAALKAYRAALVRVRETNLANWERSILVKLAELQMDLGQIEECAPLAGALTLLEPSVSSLKTRARYAWLSGDVDNAVKNMTSAREMAGDNWDDDDQTLLQSYLDNQ